MTHRTNKDINEDLAFLRDELRAGNMEIRQGDLRLVVGQLLAGSMVPLKFDTDTFKLGVLDRFETLFAVPNLNTEAEPVWPNNAEYATALQNFINRRKDVWVHVKLPPITALDAEGQGVSIG